MKAHELAKMLLEMPDLDVCCEDGGDPSDLQAVKYVEVKKASDRPYWVKNNWEYNSNYIQIS